MANRFLTIDEVSEYLRLTKPKLYNLAQRGKISAYKFGREWRFRTDKLEQWIEDQETGRKNTKVNNKR